MEADKSNTVATDGTTQMSEVEKLKKQLQQEHEMYLRALADFDNYRRRTERERTTAARSGKREILLPLLDVLDGFEHALQIADTSAPVVEGMQIIYRQLQTLLEKEGITPVTSVGEIFDPEVHEAIGSIESEKHDSGAVVDEVRRGYRWNDDVLRPARVRVAR